MASALAKKNNSHVVRHWLLQRWSGALLVPLALWFVGMALPALMRSPNEAAAWFQDPLHMGGALLWTVLLFYHGFLGVQVVLEDYISQKQIRSFWILCARVIAFGAATGACVQIIRLFWGS